MAKGQKEAKVVFTAEVSEFTKGITQINKSLSNLKSDLKACNADIKANGQSYDNLSNKQKTLKGVVDGLTDKLEMQRKCLAQAEATLGKGSEQYNRYYRAVNNTQAELSKFERELRDTEQAISSLDAETTDASGGLNRLGNAIDDVADEASQSSVKIEALGTALGNIASSALGAVTDKLSEFTDYLFSIPEATEEYREAMARVEVASVSSGKSVEDLNGLYEELFKYYNDHNATGNVIANLAQINASQETLKGTTEALQGAWAKFGDGINNETLAEDLNLTIKLGEAQGALAEVLERCGVSVDDFNTGLASCKTEEEKLQYTNEVLNGSLGEVKQAYENAHGAQLNYNSGLLDATQKEADVAGAVMDIQNEWTTLKGILIQEVTPAIEGLATATEGSATAIGEMLNGLTSSNTWQVLGDIFNTIGGLFEEITMKLGAFGLTCTNTIEGVVSLFSGKWEDAKNAFGNAFDWMGEFCTLSTDSWKSDIEDASNSGAEDVSIFADKSGEAFAKLQESAGSGAKNAQKSVNDATTQMKKDIDDVANKKFEIKRPETSGATKQVETATTSMKNGIDSVANKQYSLKRPETSGATKQVETATTSMKNSANTLSRHGYSLNRPNTSNATSAVNTATSTMRNTLSRFKPSWSIPRPSLPSFSASIRWTTTTVLGKSFRYPSGISWHKLGGIFTQPTLFATPGGMHGVGEAGAEAVLPLDSFYKHLDDKIDEVQGYNNIININLNDMHIHDNLDVNTLAERLAFEVQRKMRFK